VKLRRPVPRGAGLFVVRRGTSPGGGESRPPPPRKTPRRSRYARGATLSSHGTPGLRQRSARQAANGPYCGRAALGACLLGAVARRMLSSYSIQ